MRSFARGLLAQLEVVHALVLRETRTRFGVYQLGYLWALIEPLVWIGTFWGMFWMVNRQAPFGMSLMSFMATGIVPYLLFRDTAGKAISAIDGNKALLYYPQVRPLDLVLARAALEFATYTVVFFTLLGGNALVTGETRVESVSGALCALALACLLGLSLGLIFCSLCVFWPSTPQVIAPLMRPLFWGSGLFFTANGLPSGARKLLVYNPVLHIVELARDSWFETYDSHYASVPYVLGWILGLACLGLILERVSRRSIEVT